MIDVVTRAENSPDFMRYSLSSAVFTLVLDRFILVTVPLAYAFSPSAYVLIAVGAFWGISTALGQASMTFYLLEVAPEEYLKASLPSTTF